MSDWRRERRPSAEPLLEDGERNARPSDRYVRLLGCQLVGVQHEGVVELEAFDQEGAGNHARWDGSALDQHDGKLESVTLDTGETIEVGTLLYKPPEQPTPLVTSLVETLGLDLDEHGYVAVDELQRTNVERLWAEGDVQEWMGGIESANAGGVAATMIIANWYPTGTEAD